MRFSSDTPPKAATTRPPGGMSCRARIAAICARGRHRPPDAHSDGVDRRFRECGPQLAGERRIVHGHPVCRTEDGPEHGPRVVQGPGESVDRRFCAFGRELRMVESELGTVIGETLPAEERPGARMVQLGVVEHHQAAITEHIGPHVVVAPRVPSLEDDSIVSGTMRGPDELMRIVHCESRGSSTP